MRRLFLFSGIAAAAALVAVFLALAFIDINAFRPRVQASLEKQLARRVALGTMSLRYLPLSIRIADVAIAEDPNFKTGRNFVSAGEVSVSVGLVPLLRRELHVRSFVLRDPAIELVQDRAGKWNFSTLGAGASGSERSQDGPGGALHIAEFRVENGALAVVRPAEPRSVYRNIDIGLTGFAPGSPLRLRLGAALPDGGGSVLLDAAGGPMNASPAQFTGRVEVSRAGIAALRAFLGAGAAQADGTLDGAIDFQWKDRRLSAGPRLALEDLRIGGKSLGRKLTFEGALEHDPDSGLLRVTGAKLLAGGIPIAIRGEVDTRRSTLDLTLRTSGAPLAELLAIAAVFGATAAADSGTLTLDARLRGPAGDFSALELLGQGALRDASLRVPSLTAPVHVRSADLKLAGREARVGNLAASLGGSTVRGSLSVRNFAAPSAGFTIDIDKVDIAELQKLARTTAPAPANRAGSASPGRFHASGELTIGVLRVGDVVFQKVRTGCSLAGGVLSLAPLSAEVFGGRQTGGITVDLRAEPASVRVHTQLESVDANQLLSATTSLRQVLFGMLAANGEAAMKLLPGAAAARTLNGKLIIYLAQGRLGGINLMNEIAAAGRFIGFAGQAAPFTDIVSLTGDVLVRDGVAASDNLMLRMQGGSLAAAGNVNLADESIDLRVTAVLERETSQQAGGSRVGGYLTTALINSRGEIVIPAMLTGTLSKPRFTPDAARFARMKMENVLPAAAGAVDLVKGKASGKSVLQTILGNTGAAPSAAPAPEPAAPPAAEPRRKGLLDVLERVRERTAPKPANPPAPQP